VESSSDAQMIQYLLGELSAEEKAQFEETYFSDDRIFEALQIVETELVDSYVRGNLSSIQRQQFETSYLNSPERIGKVETARCLMTALVEASSQKSDPVPSKSVLESIRQAFLRLSAPARIGYAVAAVALCFAFVMTIQNRGLRSEIVRLEAESASVRRLGQGVVRQATQSPGSPGQQTRDELRHAESLIASISLTPGLSRGTESRSQNELVVPRTARWIVLSLRLDTDEYPGGYNAIVEKANGDEVLRVDRVKSHAGIGGERVVEVQLPGELLASDSYVVKLVGLTRKRIEEEADEYSLQVIRK
jgi:hypothetical protein